MQIKGNVLLHRYTNYFVETLLPDDDIFIRVQINITKI